MTKLLMVVTAVGVLGLGACSDPSVDERAHELIDRLGPMCQHFDFQTKEKVGPGEVRRVWCSEVETTDAHPQFQLIVFSDDETRSQFAQLPVTLGHDFSQADWMVVGDDRALLARVRDRLVGG